MAITFDLQFFAEKTEKATPKKKRDARKKGQVAKSTDLTNAFVLLGAFSMLKIYGGAAGIRLLNLEKQVLTDFLLWNINLDSVPLLFFTLFKEAVIVVGPLIFAAWLASLVTNLSQVGFLFTTESLKFDLKKINPIEGAKRIFSIKTIVEFIKSLLKLAAILIVSSWLIWNERGNLIKLPQMELYSIIAYLAALLIRLGITISAVYLVIAVADLIFQRYDHAKKLRMSKQEVKDEFKKTEGDPLIKHRIKEKQRQIATARMMEEVPKAQVIITNPTHYAVAIAYEAGKMEVPVVVAKGADYLALKIKEVAKEHGIVIMENKPLARLLYETVEMGQEIPEELFKAVAEVLAYVYKVKGTLAK